MLNKMAEVIDKFSLNDIQFSQKTTPHIFSEYYDFSTGN